MNAIKPRVKGRAIYGFSVTPTSGGIVINKPPIVCNSSPTTSFISPSVELRNKTLQDYVTGLDDLMWFYFDGGTGGNISNIRPWVEEAIDQEVTNQASGECFNASDAIAEIRSALSLQIKELADILNVSRPTIYAWLKNEEQPNPQNRTRIVKVLRLAKIWNSIRTKPVGPSIRNEIGPDGLSLVELLSQPNVKDSAVTARMRLIAEKNKGNPKGIEETAKKNGIDKAFDKGSQANFDVLTGKPFHED